MPTHDKNVFDDFPAFAERILQMLTDTMKTASSQVEDSLGKALYEFIHEGTKTIGNAVTPIATHPVIQFATKVPGFRWLMAALGQINTNIVQQEVETLRRTHPLDSKEVLAQRIIVDAAWKAGGIGLITNLVPPLALTLFAVDFGAIAALQAEMIYRIAVIYGFSPTEPARRGEVLVIWLLSIGSSGMVKSGLSAVELIPVVGAAVGSAGDAAMLYSLGQIACRFYEAKQKGSTNL